MKSEGELRMLLAGVQESDARFRLLFDSNIIGVKFANVHGTITDANDLFLGMLGYDRSDLPIHWDGMTPTVWCEQDQQKMQATLDTGVGTPWEKEYYHKDGSRVPVLVGTALLDKDAGTFICFTLDLSETKNVGIALRESEERYKALYENIPLMYFTLASDGTVLSVNSSGAGYLGYRKEDLVGQPVTKVIYEKDHPALAKQFSKLLKNPTAVSRWNLRKVRQDGSRLWVQETARTMRQADGQLVVLVICEDISERKQAENRLAEHREEVRQLAARLFAAEELERRRIAKGLHDDIGQNLAMAKLRLGMLAERDIPDEVAEETRVVLELIQQTIQKSRSLTFELSSPVLHELGLGPAVVELGEWVEQGHGIRFHLEADEASKVLSGDVGAVIYQSVRQLLINVVQHSRAGNATVTLRTVDGAVEVGVEDDGVGFEISDAGRFTRKGGFGLFSIREAMQRINGRVEIESRAGKGTRAVVTVPLEDEL